MSDRRAFVPMLSGQVVAYRLKKQESMDDAAKPGAKQAKPAAPPEAAATCPAICPLSPRDAERAGSAPGNARTARSQTTPTATYTADFTIQRLSSRVGCIAGRSCAAAGNDLLFLARDGVRSLAKTQEDGDGAVSLPLSEPIQDVMDRINLAKVHLAAGGWWRGRYMLAVPLDSRTVNNAVLVLNLRTGGWQVWTGIQAVAFALSAFNGQQQRAGCEQSLSIRAH
jgi:hypothetical protein